MKKIVSVFILLIVLFALGVFGYNQFLSEPTTEEVIANELRFDDTVTMSEKEMITTAAIEQTVVLTEPVTVAVSTTTATNQSELVSSVYVPVTTFNSVTQAITSAELATSSSILLPNDTDPIIVSSLASELALAPEVLKIADDLTTDLQDEQVAFIPFTELDKSYKLLSLNGSYYLDDFVAGAVFRTVVFDKPVSGFGLPQTGTDDIYKVNMTGVTALTRIMQRKLEQVGNDPLYFSAKIGDFLANADLTHVSNEVSFKEACPYSNTLFCSPPEFIETLKASGVDLVELTGNHNNDLGSQFNTTTIQLYDSLGWGTVGGGLTTEDAAKPFVADTKDSNVTFLAYNYPDSPNGGAISGIDSAGANSFDITKIGKDITAAKTSSDFVIVNVQYWECYAYPDGYIEYPVCDQPIGEQEAVFKNLVDLGADMVVGSSAHQPQTYELYNGSPIYYGLGNLYFDQTNWPGTERGIVLTHYFNDGELLQTKLTPTVYDSDLQTRVATADEVQYLLTRLQAAR